jgi:hypothetical protein
MELPGEPVELDHAPVEIQKLVLGFNTATPKQRNAAMDVSCELCARLVQLGEDLSAETYRIAKIPPTSRDDVLIWLSAAKMNLELKRHHKEYEDADDLVSVLAVITKLPDLLTVMLALQQGLQELGLEHPNYSKFLDHDTYIKSHLARCQKALGLSEDEESSGS